MIKETTIRFQKNLSSSLSKIMALELPFEP